MVNLPCKERGFIFDVPLKNKDGSDSKKTTKMRIHRVFKFSNTNFEYHLERYNEKTKEWQLINERLFKHSEINKYF